MKTSESLTFKPISGTFLDGIAADIPSQNWGTNEWKKQFDVFRTMGMDSVIIIRIGWKDMAMYDSKVIQPNVYDPDDRVALFLDQAQRTGLRLYMGLHDTFKYWLTFDSESEVAINLDVISELHERYGNHPAFYGWYISHEPALASHPWEIWNPLIKRMRQLTPDKPVLLSPRFEGRKFCKEEFRTPQAYAGAFGHTMEHMEEDFDAAAFMDGHVGFGELAEYLSAMKLVFEKYTTELWSNLETFDRDMPIRFPPIDWLKMRTKLEAVQPYVTKIITFEAPHFLSPYSMWESARTLYERYMAYINDKEQT